MWGDAVDHVYLPYDVPGSVGRFWATSSPAALITETELWPNLLFGCRDRDIPVYILNARLSARSLRGYRLLRPLIGRTLRTVTCVAAQSADDAERFIQLGALPEQVQPLGNLKFDIATPNVRDFTADFHAAVPGTRPVWIAASTHEGEEQATIDLHRRLRRKFRACCCCGRRAIPNASRALKRWHASRAGRSARAASSAGRRPTAMCS